MRLFLLLCALLPACALAGTRAVYQQAAQPGTLVFDIADNGDYRAGAPDGRQYRLVIGGEAYQVAQMDGQWVTARLADIEDALHTTPTGLGRGLIRSLSALAAATPQRIAYAGETEVNGWRGAVYLVHGADWEFDRQGAWRDPDGPPWYILSRDPALRQVGPALTDFTAGELAFGRHLLSDGAHRALLDILHGLAAHGTLVESSEHALQLLRVEAVAVPPAQLALPAPPLSRTALAALIREGRSPFRPIVRE